MAKRPVARKTGRPTKRTDAVVKRIVDGLGKGTPLTVLCRPANMPSDRTVREWMEGDVELSSAIARAREAGFDAIASDILPIADDLTDDPASRRVRVEARLKLLAKWDPKRYGDRVDHTSSDGSMSPPKSLSEFYGHPAGADLSSNKTDSR